MATDRKRRHSPRFVRTLVERLEEEHGSVRLIARFDPIEELVSCILSQHTSDANSFPTFTLLLESFPTWQDVVDAGPERVAEVIRGAGLSNQKSKNIVGALEEIYRRVGSYSLEPLRQMPMLEARAWLMSLPGVGPKTASIVICFALGGEAIPVDTHVFRVSWRIGIIDKAIGENKAHDVLLQIVPGDLAFRFHTMLIQHGRLVCRARDPRCHECRVSDVCWWYRTESGRVAA